MPLTLGVIASAAISAQSLQRNPADIDGSGLVDLDDFFLFAQNFGKTGTPFDPSARDTVLQVIRDTIEIVRTDTVFSARQDVGRPEESDWQTIFANERGNVYWLGVGVEEPGYSWSFVGTGFAVGTDVLCTNSHVALGLQERISNIRSDLTAVFVAVPADGTGRDAYRLAVAENNNILLKFSHPNYNESPSSADVALVFTTKEMPGFSRLVSSLDAMELEVGQEIATIGYPGEIDSDYDPVTRLIPTSKTGIVSALRPYDEATPSATIWGRIANKIVQHNFDTTPGTSGSPIFNKRGEIVAVNNAIAVSGTGSLGFGIRADEARDLMRAIYVEHRDDFDGLMPEDLLNLIKPVVR